MQTAGANGGLNGDISLPLASLDAVAFNVFDNDPLVCPGERIQINCNDNTETYYNGGTPVVVPTPLAACGTVLIAVDLSVCVCVVP